MFIFCSGGNDDSSGAVGSGGSSSCSPGDDEDEHTLSCRGGAMEGAAEEVEGLITQTTDADQSVDYELVDLNTTTTVTTQVNHQTYICDERHRLRNEKKTIVHPYKFFIGMVTNCRHLI